MVLAMGLASSRGLRATTSWVVEQLGVDTRPRWPARVVAVDLGHHEGHVRVHPESGALVDHECALLDGHRRYLAAYAASGRDEDNVDFREQLRGYRLHRNFAAVEFEPLAPRALGGAQPDLLHRESALLDDPEQDATNGARCADDCDPQAIQ